MERTREGIKGSLGVIEGSYLLDEVPNWTTSTLPSSTYWGSVTYGNGKFVAVANNSNKSAYANALLELVEGY